MKYFGGPFEVVDKSVAPLKSIIIVNIVSTY